MAMVKAVKVEPVIASHKTEKIDEDEHFLSTPKSKMRSRNFSKPAKTLVAKNNSLALPVSKPSSRRMSQNIDAAKLS